MALVIIFPPDTHGHTGGPAPIFDSSDRIVWAVRYELGATFGVQFLGINLLGTPVSDTVVLNLHEDNGSGTAPSATIALAGSTETSPTAPGVNLNNLIGSNQTFQRRWDPLVFLPAGTYWLVASLLGGSPHSGIESSWVGYTSASPAAALNGSSLGSLSPSEALDDDAGPTFPLISRVDTAPVIPAGDTGWVAVIG